MNPIRNIAVLASALIAGTALGQEASEAELAKQSQNPVAAVISIPIEFWSHRADAGFANALIAKPVVPTQIGRFNLINRFIVPYVSIDAGIDSDIPIGPLAPGGPNTEIDINGLADFTYQAFFSPAAASKVIWGVGAAITAPIGKEGISSDRWSAGPSFVVLTMPGKWVLGALVQNVWDFAGSGDKSVNRLTFQPFINYNFGQGWYAFTNPIITANWEKDSKWTVPLGGGIGKMHRFGATPVDFKLGYFSNVERPERAPDHSLFFAIKFLIPTG